MQDEAIDVKCINMMFMLVVLLTKGLTPIVFDGHVTCIGLVENL